MPMEKIFHIRGMINGGVYMETNSPVRNKLVSQIEDEYGKVVYTYTCHLKQAKVSGFIASLLSWADIILTAITAGGLLGTLFTDQKVFTVVSAVCAALALALNLYQKEAKLSEKSLEQKMFAQNLWLSRERYISLLTDEEAMTDKELQEKRDDLLKIVNDLYSKEPMTGFIAYRMTQKALRKNQVQVFSREELNNMLPESLRR